MPDSRRASARPWTSPSWSYSATARASSRWASSIAPLRASTSPRIDRRAGLGLTVVESPRQRHGERPRRRGRRRTATARCAPGPDRAGGRGRPRRARRRPPTGRAPDRGVARPGARPRPARRDEPPRPPSAAPARPGRRARPASGPSSAESRAASPKWRGDGVDEAVVDEATARRRLEIGGDALVPAQSVGLREAGVGDLTDEVGAERPVRAVEGDDLLQLEHRHRLLDVLHAAGALRRVARAPRCGRTRPRPRRPRACAAPRC